MRVQTPGHSSRGHSYPCGLVRREALWQMGGGFAGVALAALLEQDGFFTKHLRAAEPTTATNPMAPRPAHFATKAKSCIFLLMNGGPSQVDTWDHKPALEKYAGQPMPADKKFINSGGRAVGYLAPQSGRFVLVVKAVDDLGLLSQDARAC